MALIHHLPTYEKPREKALQFGIDSLSNSELLALLIRNGTKEHSALDIAKELLDKSGGIGNLSSSSIKELTSVKGISNVKALELQAVFTLLKRISFEKIEHKDVIHSQRCFLQWLKLRIGFEKIENFMVVYLDNANHIINYKILFKGTVNYAMIYPREIVKEALLSNAVSMILVHNHPSQNISPSKEDYEITKRILEACKLLEINVLDHLIVTGQECYSILFDKSFH